MVQKYKPENHQQENQGKLVLILNPISTILLLTTEDWRFNISFEKYLSRTSIGCSE